MSSIDNIRARTDKKADLELKSKQHEEQLASSQSLQGVLFDSFQALVGVLAENGTKAEAVGLVVNALEKLDKQVDVNTTDVGLIKTGLTELYRQLKEVPTEALLEVPRFLEITKATDLRTLEQGVKKLGEAIEKLELHVEAPVVNVPAPQVNVEAPNVTVPAPVVNVPETNLEPLKQAMTDVLDGIKGMALKLTDGAVETRQVNTLIGERFDEYRVVYDTFDDESDPTVEAINYYYKGKKVATLKYKYDKNGNLTSGKKA